MATSTSLRRLRRGFLLLLVAYLAASAPPLVRGQSANAPGYGAGPPDEGAARVWKVPGKTKTRPNEAPREKSWAGPDGAAMWRLLQENDVRCDAFLIGSWEEMAAGKLSGADFQPVSPPDLGAALGLATVYGPDTAGWFVAAGRRLHVRTTDVKRDYVTLSYESLARMGWAAGVASDATPAARILWDHGAEKPLSLRAFLSKAVSEAPATGAWIVAGMADFSKVTGQSLRRSPAGAPMNNDYSPANPERSYYSPVEAADQRALLVALVVKADGSSEAAQALGARFFAPGTDSAPEGCLIRVHYADFRKPLPPMDFTRPFQTIWKIPDGKTLEDLPQVSNVREALAGTLVRRAHVSVYAIGRVVPYSLYKTPELVDPTEMDPSILSEQRWATDRSFVGEPIYDRPRILVRKEVAEALVRVSRRLQERGFRLKIYDAYRPLSVTQRLYRLKPDSRYLAVPNVGSRHNRGAAVDATLTDLKGREIEMPSPYLTFDETSHRDARGMTAAARKHLALLTEIMAAEGFAPINEEWWHFDAPNWEQYPVMDVPLWPAETDAAAETGAAAETVSRSATKERDGARAGAGEPLSPATPGEGTSLGQETSPAVFPETPRPPTGDLVSEKDMVSHGSDEKTTQPAREKLDGASASAPVPSGVEAAAVAPSRTAQAAGPPEIVRRSLGFLSPKIVAVLWRFKFQILLVLAVLYCGYMYIKSRS